MQSIKVLFLEDSQRDFEIVKQKLTDDLECSFNMDSARNEQQFVALIKSNKYDVILSDYSSPGYSGVAALDQAKIICPKTPFICVSGRIGEDIAVDMLKQGAVDYILKDRLGRLASSVVRAIKEAKAHEEKERLSNSLKEAQKIAHMGSIEWDAVSGVLTWSEEAYRIYGLDPQTAEAACGIGYTGMDEEDKVRVKAALQKTVGEKCPLDETYWITRPDEQRRCIHFKVSPKVDSDGKLVALNGFMQDITERKLAEKQVERHADLERTIRSLAQDFINVSLEKLEETVNNTMGIVARFYSADRATLYHYDWEQRKAIRLNKWVSDSVLSDDDEWKITPLDAIEVITDRHKRGLAYKTSNLSQVPKDSAYYRIAEKSKTESVISIPLMKDGKAIGSFTLSSAIECPDWPYSNTSLLKLFCEVYVNLMLRKERETALNEANESNRMILNSTNDGIGMMDRDGHILNINEKFAQRFGKTVEDTIGMTMKQFLPKDIFGDLYEQRLERIHKAFDSGEPERFEDSRGGFYFYNRYYPVWKDGRVSAVTLFSTDITDRKKQRKKPGETPSLG